MAKAKLFNYDETGWKHVVIHCPGCNQEHVICVGKPNDVVHPVWSWNNSLDKPTFNPSLLVRMGSGVDPKYEDIPGFPTRCHSFIREGKIQFLNDCDHDLKGHTVDLPEIIKDGK